VNALETISVELNLIELGWLTVGGTVWERAKAGDPIARALYLKLKAAAIGLGVRWYYGDPWPVEEQPGAK
jgi:hypothetical protein